MQDLKGKLINILEEVWDCQYESMGVGLIVDSFISDNNHVITILFNGEIQDYDGRGIMMGDDDEMNIIHDDGFYYSV